MSDYPRLTVQDNIDTEAQCYYRYVYGANDIFYPHKHEYYEIFITISGIVDHWINGELHRLPEGSLVFIRPEDTHGYLYERDESGKTEYVNLAFTREIAEALFNFLSMDFPFKNLLEQKMPPTVILNGNAKKRLLSQLGELNTINCKNKQNLKLRVKTILADIFTQNFYEFEVDHQSSIPMWLNRLLKDMESVQNFTAGIDRMIALSGKSREHLSRSIKKNLGLTATEYINNLRINYAANLLMNSNIPIVDICFMCGFQNLGYFYKVFKNQYNLSPAKFKTEYSHESEHH